MFWSQKNPKYLDGIKLYALEDPIGMRYAYKPLILYYLEVHSPKENEEVKET